MKSIIKGNTLLGFLVVAAFILPTAVLKAQNSTTTNPAQSAQNLSAPQIYANNLVIDKTSVAQGETVTGHVDFVNRGNAPSSDIYYDVILVGTFVNRVPQAMYDSVRQGPITLDVGEHKTVNFSYALPSGFAGTDMGIRVQAVLKSGVHMGWSDAHLSIAGTSTILTAGSGVLSIDGKSYLPDSGPTVSEDGSVAYNVTLSNRNDANISVVPHIVVYRYGAGNVIVSDTTGDAVTVSAGKSMPVGVSLPIMGNQPGIYYGTLTFVDDSMDSRSQVMTFRYIISGNIVTVQGVSADAVSAVPGDNVNVTVTYTGAPFNIDNGQRVSNGMVTMTVTALDAKGSQVGQATGEVDAGKPVQSAVIAVPIVGTADALRFDVTMKKGDSVLSKYSSNPVAIAGLPTSPFLSKNSMALYVAIVVSIIAIILGLILIKKSKKNNSVPPIIGLQGALLLTIVFFGLSLVRLGVLNAFVAQTSNFQTYGNPGGTSWPLFVNFPYDNQQLLPGQLFYLEGVAIFAECDNVDYGQQTLNVNYNSGNSSFVVGPTTPSTASSSLFSIINQVNDGFSLGPFTAPPSPGTYRMGISFNLPSNYLGVPQTTNVETGYIDTIVVASGLPQTGIYQSASTPPCGGYSGLSWYAVPGATEYQLYRDSAPTPVYDGSALSYTDHVTAFTTHSYYVIALINDVPQPQSNTISVKATDYCQLYVQYFSGAPNPAVPNQAVMWIANATGGSGVYNFSWTGDEGLSSASGSVIPSGIAISKSYSSTGTKNATVTVTSSDGQNASASNFVLVQTSNGYDSIQCSAAPSNALVDHPVTWSVSVTPPNNTYTYLWKGTDGMNISTTSPSVDITYKTPGLKYAQVDIVGVGSNPDCVTSQYLRWNSQFQEL